jgi:hypothetical protein
MFVRPIRDNFQTDRLILTRILFFWFAAMSIRVIDSDVSKEPTAFVFILVRSFEIFKTHNFATRGRTLNNLLLSISEVETSNLA